VELSFDLLRSRAFSDHLRERAVSRLGSRLTDGVITITASAQRSQLQNRQAAEKRLVEILAEAIAPPPRKRRATKPSRSSVEKRISSKKRRGETKRLRSKTDE
jgi:ribosome-associated protein